MDDVVKRYRDRRQARLDARLRQDDEENEVKGGGKGNGANTRLPYGIAKGEGIDTQGMSPKEVWQALEGKGVSATQEYQKLRQRGEQKKPATKSGNKPSREKTTVYKDYGIDHNIYGNGEYSVQYEGDDLIFKTKKEAKKFIDEVTGGVKGRKYVEPKDPPKNSWTDPKTGKTYTITSKERQKEKPNEKNEAENQSWQNPEYHMRGKAISDLDPEDKGLGKWAKENGYTAKTRPAIHHYGGTWEEGDTVTTFYRNGEPVSEEEILEARKKDRENTANSAWKAKSEKKNQPTSTAGYNTEAYKKWKSNIQKGKDAGFSEKEVIASLDFLNAAKDMGALDAPLGHPVDSRDFSHVGMTPKKAVDVLNSMGMGKYELKESERSGRNQTFIRRTSKESGTNPKPERSLTEEQSRELDKINNSPDRRTRNEKLADTRRYKEEIRKYLESKGDEKTTNRDYRQLQYKLKARSDDFRNAWLYWKYGPGAKKLGKG